jgi:tetratricopeptide (TPR) repeat protein
LIQLAHQGSQSHVKIGFSTTAELAMDADRSSRSPFFRTMWTVFVGALSTVLIISAALTQAQDRPQTFDEVVANAAAARDQGDLPHAISLYRQAVELNPKWPDGWWYLGSLQYGTNAYAPAAEALTQYIGLTPGAGPALALRGLCEFEQGKYPESLQDLQQGISRGAANQPRNAVIILYHEALLLTKTSRFEEALGQFTLMAKHGTINNDVIKGIGLAGMRVPVFPKDIDPSQAEMVSMVGRAASDVMGGKLSEAHDAFQQVFQRFPDTPNLHYLYGYLLFTVDPDQAIAQFENELIVSPASGITHGMLAWAYGLRADYAASLPNAKKAVAEDPSLPMAQLVLGRALVETGDVAGGLPHLQTVLASDPQNLEAHLALAKAYSKLGKTEDARRERLQCLAISGQGTAPDATM